MMLYQATGDYKYLDLAISSGTGMIIEFDTDKGMVSSAETEVGKVTVPINNLDGAINYNYLSHLVKDQQFKEEYHLQSKKIWNLLDQQKLAKTTANLPELMRAKSEMQDEPYHAVYISDGNDESHAQEFYRIILGHTNQYIIFERAVIGQFSEEQEILYSGIPAGTLFMCTSSYCSAPINSLKALQEFLVEQ